MLRRVRGFRLDCQIDAIATLIPGRTSIIPTAPMIKLLRSVALFSAANVPNCCIDPAKTEASTAAAHDAKTCHIGLAAFWVGLSAATALRVFSFEFYDLSTSG